MWLALVVLGALASPLSAACTPSATTVSGTHAPATVCSGELIFADDFNEFDLEIWEHEGIKAGRGSGEFQEYDNNRTNSFAHSGLLFIRPSLAPNYGKSVTSKYQNGSSKPGNSSPYPIKSARIRTVNSFSFRYGRMEARAKMPAGDWLWPAIWLLPAFNSYGTWPASGEIDLVESRGNRNMLQNGVHIGTQRVAPTLNYGPYRGANGWPKAHWIQRNITGYDTSFHRYQLEWTPDFMKFSIDDIELGRVSPGEGGFWEHGGFNTIPNIHNPWRYRSKMAPFDQKFYIIINVAVGGTSGYFPNDASNPTPKPWINGSPTAVSDFWAGRAGWLPTWKLDVNDGQDASLQVDYVRVWAL